MSITLKYVLVLIWLCYVLVSAVILFARGFLLNRNTLPNNSRCRFEVYAEDLNEVPLNVLRSGDYCLGHRDLKGVIVLVDALRYDFVKWSDEGSKSSSFYRNKMPRIKEALDGPNALLYKFIADPPTTTLQRINALTTGSLPTFIDIGSNFVSGSINEDNLIDAALSKSKSIIFMGDDTWVNAYPNRFKRAFAFPSFNVWDLDTVDTGVEKEFFPELEKTDWDIIIAHFLGVDHCGHKYGPNHPEMERKLTEMDTIIGSVIEKIDNNTVLFVIGDHGMTETGDHGGDTEDEVTSALFVYTKHESALSRFTKLDRIPQIDIVPTFSQLLNIPIPYSNLGTTLLTSSETPVTQNAAVFSLWANIVQLTRYITELNSVHKTFSEVSLEYLTERHKTIENLFLKPNETLIQEARDYLNSVQSLCREIWVQFDSYSMSRGLVCMFLVLALVFIMTDGIADVDFVFMVNGNFVWVCLGMTFILDSVTLLFYYKKLLNSLELTIYFTSCLSCIMVLSLVVIINWTSIADKWYKSSKVKEPLSIFSRIIMLVGSCALFSNSYIVDESYVAPFLLVTIIWLSVFDAKTNNIKKFVGKTIENSFKFSFQSFEVRIVALTVALNVLIRVSYNYWQCREEQARYCSVEKKTSKTFLCVLSILSFSLFIALVRMYLRNIGNLVGWSPSVLISRYFPSLGITCCGCYWLLNSLPHKVKPKLFYPWQLQLFPQTVIFTSILALIVIYIWPLCVYSTSNKNQFNSGNMIPTLFNKLKNIMMPGQSENYPVVYGLATAYSAVFINISVFIGLISAIVLGETLAVVAIIMMLSLALLSAVMGIARLEKHRTIGKLLSVPWSSVLCWSLSSIHFFYATGHQASFLNINWNTAGLFGDITSNVVPGILILFNTFTSQIVHALLLPFLIIIPFTLMSIWPKLAPGTDDFKKSELLIYEFEESRRQELFSLTSKYIIIQAFRVFICMFSACIHSRHLMVWKIFAPKLIFEATGFFISLPFLFLGYSFMERISSRLGLLMESLSHID